MTRVALALAMLALVALGTPSVSSAGFGCCICSTCSGDPDPCGLPLISCDVTCGQVGCSDATTGDSTQCMMLPPCSPPALLTNPAPTASLVGLGVVAAALAGFGAWRLARRQRRA